MKNSLMAGFYSNAWIYDPWSRTYTFLPGWGGFSSPYGFRYSNCNPYWSRNPYGYSNNGNNGWGNGNNGWGNGGGGNSGASNSGGQTYSKGTSSVSTPPPPPPPSTGSSLGGRDHTMEKRRDN